MNISRSAAGGRLANRLRRRREDAPFSPFVFLCGASDLPPGARVGLSNELRKARLKSRWLVERRATSTNDQHQAHQRTHLSL